jgi:mRNA interferase MazF
VNLEPVIGHEQGEQRPAVIVSASRFNRSAAELVIVAPITSKDKKVPLHVLVMPPEGGVKYPSWVMCDQIRAISKRRLEKRWGSVSPPTLEQINDRLRVVLNL